ncbi:MAG: hypothetical protein PHS49_07405, partial [Candidatus Gracilibacteria bacterium]|nr:hypothetical protein [Candidatus Gracilibacteria bacterium]
NSVDGASKASNGGGGIDYSNNLTQINSQIDSIKAKIKAIEEKGDSMTTQDKREKYALNKELNTLEVKKTEAAIKAEDKTTEAVIKKYDDEFDRKQKLINQGIQDLQNRFK